jgi:sugar phosphate isomerase/epimerase
MSAPRLSCADSAFPRLTHTGSLDVIRDLGISAVDVCVFSGYDHNPPETVLPDPAAAADRVGGRLAERGLVVSDVFAIVGDSFEALAPNHPDAAVREESRRVFDGCLEFARRLGSPGLTILPGLPFDDDGMARAATELEERARRAAAAGLRLAVEPHLESVVSTPARTLELLERTELVGVALDLSHFAFQGIAQEESYPLLPRTHHVHLRQGGPDVVQARVAEGTIDFRALRDRLLDDGYEGYFALEYQWEEGWHDFTRVDCIAETADMRDLMLEER